MSLDRRGTVVAGATVAALIGFGLLWHARADDVRDALALFPLWGLAACVLLHVLTLVARSEASWLSLTAIEGKPVPRAAVHGANAGAFCCGALLSHCAMPARVALLRRLARDSAPGTGQIVVADVPIFLLEVAGTAGLLALAGELWALPLAVAPLAAGRALHGRLGGRRSARGLRVLADDRLAVRLAGWVGAITGLGPTAPAAGALASSGSGDVALGLAAGAVIAASTLIAVAIYAGVVALTAGMSERRVASLSWDRRIRLIHPSEQETPNDPHDQQTRRHRRRRPRQRCGAGGPGARPGQPESSGHRPGRDTG
jgi:hypothetical protein